jgi:hypothetical protein
VAGVRASGMPGVEQRDDFGIVGFVDAGHAAAREETAGEAAKDTHRGLLDRRRRQEVIRAGGLLGSGLRIDRGVRSPTPILGSGVRSPTPILVRSPTPILGSGLRIDRGVRSPTT